MYKIKKNIFIEGTPYFIGNTIEIKPSIAALLLSANSIEEVEATKEVSIKPKRTRKEK